VNFESILFSKNNGGWEYYSLGPLFDRFYKINDHEKQYISNLYKKELSLYMLLLPLTTVLIFISPYFIMLAVVFLIIATIFFTYKRVSYVNDKVRYGSGRIKLRSYIKTFSINLDKNSLNNLIRNSFWAISVLLVMYLPGIFPERFIWIINTLMIVNILSLFFLLLVLNEKRKKQTTKDSQ
jgi:hypothetical protein